MAIIDAWSINLDTFQIDVTVEDDNSLGNGQCAGEQAIFASVQNPNDCVSTINKQDGTVLMVLTGNTAQNGNVNNAVESYDFVFQFQGGNYVQATKQYDLKKKRIRILWKDKPQGSSGTSQQSGSGSVIINVYMNS